MNGTKLREMGAGQGEQVVAGLVGLAQEAFSDEVGNTDAGLVAFERAVARRTLRRRGLALPWLIDAGPYSVHVIGPEFDIKWLASDEVLDLHLLKGAIVVRGPLARDGIAMEAGAHLFANVRKGEIRLDGQPSGAGEPGAGAATNAA